MFGFVFEFFENVLKLDQLFSLVLKLVLHLIKMCINISLSIGFLTFLFEQPKLKSRR
jgi:hypothetical protein